LLSGRLDELLDFGEREEFLSIPFGLGNADVTPHVQCFLLRLPSLLPGHDGQFGVRQLSEQAVERLGQPEASQDEE